MHRANIRRAEERTEASSEVKAASLDLNELFGSLQPGDMLTLIGLDLVELSAAIVADSSTPCILKLDLSGPISAATAIGRILDDLADLALTLWHHWAEADPHLRSQRSSAPWRRAAIRLASSGRRPRFRSLAREAELIQLLSALPEIVLVAEVDPLRAERAAPIVATMEWCRRHSATVAVLLSEAPAPEPPWDRLLHRAVFVQPAPAEPATRRLIAPPDASPFGGSAVERRMRAALRAAPDLAGLFEDEVTLQLGPLGPTPRVDLLWRAGKVVVELDGFEHERQPRYGADRHRDYELLIAGYLVLRLTNAEIELDLSRSLDKIRSVVNLRRGQL
jgi:hypothetical protein